MYYDNQIEQNEKVCLKIITITSKYLKLVHVATKLFNSKTKSVISVSSLFDLKFHSPSPQSQFQNQMDVN